jgi:hypothetical protein
MFKIGMIEQIMRYLVVFILWQLSQEYKMCKCISYKADLNARLIRLIVLASHW